MKNEYQIPVIDNIAATQIKQSRVHGLGLFCNDELKAGTELCLLDGQLVPWAVFEMNQKIVEWNALPGEILLLRPFRIKYSYINHSRKPYCSVLAELTEMAVKEVSIADLRPGQELLLDYREEPLPLGYVSGHGSSYL